MTFSSQRCVLALAMLIWTAGAHAALGEAESGIEQERLHFGMQRAVQHQFSYRLHTLEDSNGARIQQYVGARGQIFAVSWQTPYKPDLLKLLGNSGSSYAQATEGAARKGGVQRQFLHQTDDLVVLSTAYLNRYSGYAYRKSLLPQSFDLSRLGKD